MKLIVKIFIFILTPFYSLQASPMSSPGKEKISGIVMDTSGLGLPYASVYIEKTSISTVTDEKGNFSFFNISEGDYSITAKQLGYKSETVDITVTEGENKNIVFKLTPDISILGEVTILGIKTKTITPTRTFTPLENLPMSVQIIDRKIIEQQQVFDLSDAVKNVSGITLSNSYSGGYNNYTARGFNLSNSSNYRRNGMFIWNMGHHYNDNIEQIEFLKGPASILFGDVTPGGVINFATKSPLTYQYRRFEMKVGQYGLLRPTLDLSGPLDKKGKLLYRLNTTYEKSNSFRDIVNNEAIMVSPTVTWHITPRLSWNVEATYKQDNRVGDPGLISPDGTFEGLNKIPVSTFLGEPSGTYGFQDKSVYSTINYHINQNWKVRNISYYTKTTRSVNNIYLVGNQADTTGAVRRRQYAFNQWFEGWGNNFDLLGTFATGFVKHQIALGGDYMINNSQFTKGIDRNLDTTINIYNPVYGVATFYKDPLNYDPQGFMYNRGGLYVQDQLSVLDEKLHLLLGLRYNIINSGTKYFDETAQPEGFSRPVQTPVTPRLGIVYKPLINTSIYASYTESFEINGNDWIIPTIVIDPTFASQVEAGIKQSLFNNKLGVTFSAFQIDKKNIYTWIDATEEPTVPYIAWDEEGEWATVQGGHHRSKGFEVDVNGQITRGFNILATAALIDARVVEDPVFNAGNLLGGSPRNTYSLWANYKFFETALKGLELGYGIFYRGSFYLNTANAPHTLINDFHTMDASVAYTFRNLTLRANVANLTNNVGFLGGFRVYEPMWTRRTIVSMAIQF